MKIVNPNVYFRIVCMWSYQECYPNVDKDGELIQPVGYHKELDWPIHLGVCWIPRAGNLCIDLLAWRIFLSIDPVWKKDLSFDAWMSWVGKRDEEEK